MIFGEIFYALFLLVTAIAYWLANHKYKPAILATSGIVCYGYYASHWLILLASVTVGSWIVLFGWDAWRETQTQKKDSTAASYQNTTQSTNSLNYQSNQQPTAESVDSQSMRLSSPGEMTAVAPANYKKYLWLATIPVFVFVLGYFKYSSFIKSMFVATEVERIVAPLGISFFTFEFIQVAAEKFKGKIGHISFIDYISFIFFFPTLIAGPIKTYDQFQEQLGLAQKFKIHHILEGICRIIVGLAKKIVIADNLNTLIQEVGSPDKTQNIILLSGAIFLYGFRIYLDFSGYSDIAIGSARLFGIHLPENFHFPYLRTNIADFWRHWHISLYSWLLTYIYIPLGGSRVGFVRNLLNIITTMFVSGVWHGADWNFIVWGLWHGFLLAIHRVYASQMKPHLPTRWVSGKIYTACSYGLTMACVWFGWSLFMWSLEDVGQYLQLVVRSVL
ncbi:MBOAT family O-acyltransferase [Geitlerinema sp. PCC 9228]|jgi:alginate O-acetyltransferase complex protein AlgI|uniref:MBOAT family O-acyltransferase n=1 Tax=Geitlerinema sp. PCC 9228 TaxID=111611 RepID=UPI0008F98E79|nr:MBOAT family O-acyltransferase [Geitlerinema sp. PCC 9228]